MQKIIDGLIYDTLRAEVLATITNDLAEHDFSFYEETLYKTPNERYFIFGQSGALGPYAVEGRAGCMIAGSNIVPMSSDEAVKWCIKHALLDVLEDEFDLG